MSHRTKDCTCNLHGFDCIVMQLTVRSHANWVIEKSFVEKGLSKSVNECHFVTTNFISTKMKTHFQSMNVKGWYCLSFDDFEC